jgi:hypothetical protein
MQVKCGAAGERRLALDARNEPVRALAGGAVSAVGNRHEARRKRR